MKIKQFLGLALMTLTGLSAHAQQPLNGCWHPDDIIQWTPDNLTKFPDNPFNIAKVPLQERFKEPTLMKANPNQFYEGEICNSTILYPTCSMCPSQGELDNFLGYQPTYWQYMDKLVYWAGAASEGIINIPPAASTDAAHAQGVKVLGNIFFPPAAFGGTQAWVRQMLTVQNGTYVYAVKLYEIAKYFGFDGWFINEESGGGRNAEWEGFFKEFYKAAEADGDYHMELQWYNASPLPNVALLKTNVNTSQFLEYGAVGDYRNYASHLGCTEAQTFSKIYAGIELAKAGHLGWSAALNSAMPTSGHVGSLDLFCPETKIWEDPAKSAFKSVSRNHGTQAYPIGKTVFDNEEDMWVNTLSDPTQTPSTGFPGVSNRILERSAITAMPFLSDMGVGNGKHRFVEGVKQGTRDWYHSGMQSILPTWRWWIENRGNLTVSIDWDNAYNTGSSFKFAGTLAAGDHLVRLYKTQVKVTDGGILRIVYKGTGASVEAKLSTTSSTTPDVTISEATTQTVNGWTVADFDLSSLNGKTLYMVALNLKAASQVSGFAWNLGQVALLPAGYNPAAVSVQNLRTTSTLGESKGDLRILWNYTWTKEFDHFDIYTVTADNKRNLVGQTRDEGFYIPTFERNGNDAYLNVEVVPVMKDGKQKQAQVLKVDYPAPQPPTISVKLDKSYVTVGTTVTITGKGTGNPTAWEWQLPEGLEFASGYNKDSNPIKVVAKAEGKQVVTLKSTNAVGTSTKTFDALDVLSASDMNLVTNVILGKTVVDYSGSTNSTEVPGKIIDGVRNPTQTSSKWCNVSSDNWVIFDLEGAYRLYGFGIWDGNAGPESGVDQIDRYVIQVSADGENWVTVVDEENREDESIKYDYIAPYKARYIKLIPHVNGTLRIWEFEVYGREDNNMLMTVEPEEMTVMAGETKNITVHYDLNGDQRSDYFVCTAASANGNVTFGTITEDKAAQTFTIPVKGSNVIGNDKVTVNLNNGGAYKERSISVTIDGNRPNILAGLDAKLRYYKSDYSYEAKYDEFTVKTLTDGNTADEACEVIENESTHKDDVWAIFECPSANGWNLAKVKVYIPNQNQGENVNGNKGAVNKEISIRVGNDLNSLTTIHTFSGLDEVSQLEYILPQFKTVKYIAVVCNLNAYFFASLAEVEAFEQYEEAVPLNGPVLISNWPHDVIAEARTAADHTNYTLDDQGWVLFTTDIDTNGAIAGPDRKLTTKQGTEFTFADYTQNNALVLKQANQPQTLTLDSPQFIEELYFLTISANGQSTLKVEANYEDGTKSQTGTYQPKDWFGSNDADVAYHGLDRIIVSGRDGFQTDQLDGRKNFRLYAFTLATDRTKKMESITFTSTVSGKYPTVLAISKKGYKVTDGIATQRPAANDQQPVAIYSINGQRLNSLQKGVNILRYSDGTVRKVVIK